MKSKKKLIISLSAAAAVLVAAIIALVAVFALGSQTVATSKIKVHYHAGAEVVGSVSAKYQIGTGSAKAMTTDGETAAENGKNSVIRFDVGKHENTKQLQLQKSDLIASVEGGQADTAMLSDANRYMVFEYTFVNAGSKKYTATLDTTVLDSTVNMTVEYAATRDAEVWDADPAEVVVAAPANHHADPISVTYYARIRIIDISFDADFAGLFSWTLVADGYKG